MVNRLFFFLVGFGFTIIGFVYIISYLNLLTIGYNFYEYVNFISSRMECIYAPIGVVMIAASILIPGGKKNELHI